MSIMFAVISIYLTLIIMVSSVTVDDINELRIQLREEYDTNDGLLATTVRLIFHDCSGPGEAGSNEIAQCNGCIDFQNNDHAGLQQGAVEPLQQIYHSGWDRIMSRADFWAACATIGLEYAQQLANDNDALREIPYYFGRIDCGDDAADAKDTKHFVSPIFGWNDVFKWFHDNLGWNEQQIVAIIGVHTLGKTHDWASGFSTLPWVDQEGVLNNEFYIDLHGGREGLYTNGWESVKAGNEMFEWHNVQNAGHPYIMLNSDMSLWYDMDTHIVNTETGEVNCNYRTCGISPVRQITQMYVDDNQRWLDDFADIFAILIQTGYTALEPIYAGNGRNNGGGNGGNTGGGRGGRKKHGGRRGGGGRGGRRGHKAMSVGGEEMIGDESVEYRKIDNEIWWVDAQYVLGWLIVITSVANVVVIVWVKCGKGLFLRIRNNKIEEDELIN